MGKFAKDEYDFISFSAGPTYISDSTRKALVAIVESGFLQVSHRSDEFSEISKQAIEGLRKEMRIPNDYHIFYQNSSTIAWDTVLQNLVAKKSFHFVLGEFSERFFHTAERLNITASKFDPPTDRAVPWENAPISKEDELIAITHNETRSGLMWPMNELQKLRKAYPDALIAIDVCSSFGGMLLDWKVADIWLGSVQKCLGMPAGFGYLIVSPRAFERSLALKKNIPDWRHFKVMEEQMKKYQTFETPNTLAIALLAKLMEDWDLNAIDQETRRKAQLIYSADLDWDPYIKDATWRSITCAHFMVNDASKWHAKAKAAHFVLGSSFDSFKKHGIRVANFPSHTYTIIEALLKALH